MRFLLATLLLCSISVLAADSFTANPNGKFDCSKKYCKNMRSCEEACYKFQVCGHYHLDGDKDQIPCENVCTTPCKINSVSH